MRGSLSVGNVVKGIKNTVESPNFISYKFSNAIQWARLESLLSLCLTPLNRQQGPADLPAKKVQV